MSAPNGLALSPELGPKGLLICGFSLPTTPQERTSSSRHTLRPGLCWTQNKGDERGMEMLYVPPGRRDSIVTVQPRYENFIGGKWLAPVEGRFRVNLTPATAQPICEVADSTPRTSSSPWTRRTRPGTRGVRRRRLSGPGC
jgi:hypothetical protein